MNEIRRMFIVWIVFHLTLAPVIRDTQTPDPALTCEWCETRHVGIKLLGVENKIRVLGFPAPNKSVTWL